MPNFIERRQHKRLQLKQAVFLRYQGRFIPATMLDLSCGGMRLSAKGHEFQASETIEVIFDLNRSNRNLGLCGKTTRKKSNNEEDVGISFTNFFSTSHKNVKNYIQENLS